MTTQRPSPEIKVTAQIVPENRQVKARTFVESFRPTWKWEVKKLQGAIFFRPTGKWEVKKLQGAIFFQMLMILSKRRDGGFQE